jgi:WD40 repeat protein
MGCNPTPSINTSNHTLSTPKSTEAILKLDTKGHTALIRDIIVTKSGAKPKGLAYSSNGEFLIAGTGAIPLNVNIYSVNRKYKKIQSFKKHKNLTIAVAFLNNSTAVSGGGDNNEIYIWDRASAEVKRKIEGVGESVWSVGVNRDSIAWGNIGMKKINEHAKLQKSINLKNFQISENLKGKRFKRVSTTFGTYSLSHRAGGDYGYSDVILDIKKDDDTISITRDATNGIRHNCYGFYKNYIISGGSNGFLKIYNRQGEEVANLVGHTGEVWSIALDGDRLVSGSDDQTIRIWDLSKLKSQMIPQLNIFVSKDNEWVVWSKSGYYNASIEGAKYVGYHINQGADKEAYYVSADKYSALYRPDIIEAIIKTGSEREGIALASKLKRVQKVEVANALPPMLSLVGRSTFATRQSSVTIRFGVKSQSPIQKLIITRNGEQITKRTIQRAKAQKVTVDLEDGENIIAIRAKNRFAMSDAIMVNVTKTSNSANIYKPTLYLLTIGVSDYANSHYNLDMADRDAKSIGEMFSKQEGKIYKRVVVKQLINREANRINILKALSWIEQEVTQRDVAIIFMAGHGVNDAKNNYYFLAHDSSKELRLTAIKWDEIRDTITSLPSKVILLADTCHSGNIMGSSKRRDITSAIKSIVETGTGSIIMTASTGRGYSIENRSWGHGAFTKALLEGIDEARADYNGNGEISIKEIDLYVTDRVKSLTDGMQKPTTIVPNSVPDFVIGM